MNYFLVPDIGKELKTETLLLWKCMSVITLVIDMLMEENENYFVGLMILKCMYDGLPSLPAKNTNWRI